MNMIQKRRFLTREKQNYLTRVASEKYWVVFAVIMYKLA